MEPKADANDAPMLPRWTSEERGLWLDLLEAYSAALLPADEDLMVKSLEHKEKKAIEAVTLAAKLADIAVQEFQFRQFAQSDVEHERAAGQGFEQFSAWLPHKRAPRRERTTTRRKR